MAATIAYSLFQVDPLGAAGALQFSIGLQEAGLKVLVTRQIRVEDTDGLAYTDSGTTLYESAAYPSAQTVTGTLGNVGLTPSEFYYSVSDLAAQIEAQSGTPDWSTMSVRFYVTDDQALSYNYKAVPVRAWRHLLTYDGTAWLPCYLRRWNGSAWEGISARRWNGSAWEELGTYV